LIDRSLAAQEGRRFSAFYRGFHDRKACRRDNPFPMGSEEARCWEAGWQFAGPEKEP